MTESRYIRLKDYCLVEYIFADNTAPLTTADFTLLKNGNLDVHQIYNSNANRIATGNIYDFTSVPIGENKYVLLDEEKPVTYLDYDPNIIVTDLGTVNNFVYDTVRFHLNSGFTFENFLALILTVKNTENDGKNNIFTSLTFNAKNADLLLKFNPKPIFLADRVYDRFIEVRIPAIKKLNATYYSTAFPAQASTFAAKITPNNNTYKGFINESPIIFALDECDRTEILNTEDTFYEVYITKDHAEATLPQVSEFDDLGVHIAEAADGDYIEFFATYNGGFPADFIGNLESRNSHDDWVIIHQLIVYEQIGSSFNEVAKFIHYQDSKFDEALAYRPVLNNAANALSFSIDYTVRLTNNNNGDQIIRTGSMSSLSPKKYGKHLIKMPLASLPQSQKIYNKLIRKTIEATELFVEPEFNRNVPVDPNMPNAGTRTVFVPVFFNYNRINLGYKNMLISEADVSDNIIYRPGDLRIILNPFDNLYKFVVYNKQDNLVKPLNLTFNSIYKLVFWNNSDRIEFSNIQDSAYEDLENGQVVFKVPSRSASIILNSNNREFYFVNINKEDLSETVLYYGFWNKISEYDQVRANNQSILTEQETTSVNLETTVPTAGSGASIKTLPMTDKQTYAAFTTNVHIPGYVPAQAGNELSNVLKLTPEAVKASLQKSSNYDTIASRALKSYLK
jgi:hypothetical protein